VIDATAIDGQQAMYGVATMNGTSRPLAAQRGGRRPANLADSELRHLENMVSYVTRKGATQPKFDQGYWEQRVCALEETHELVTSQRNRIARLRRRLTVESGMDA